MQHFDQTPNLRPTLDCLAEYGFPRDESGGLDLAQARVIVNDSQSRDVELIHGLTRHSFTLRELLPEQISPDTSKKNFVDLVKGLNPPQVRLLLSLSPKFASELEQTGAADGARLIINRLFDLNPESIDRDISSLRTFSPVRQLPYLSNPLLHFARLQESPIYNHLASAAVSFVARQASDSTVATGPSPQGRIITTAAEAIAWILDNRLFDDRLYISRERLSGYWHHTSLVVLYKDDGRLLQQLRPAASIGVCLLDWLGDEDINEDFLSQVVQICVVRRKYVFGLDDNSFWFQPKENNSCEHFMPLPNRALGLFLNTRQKSYQVIALVPPANGTFVDLFNAAIEEGRWRLNRRFAAPIVVPELEAIEGVLQAGPENLLRLRVNKFSGDIIAVCLGAEINFTAGGSHPMQALEVLNLNILRAKSNNSESINLRHGILESDPGYFRDFVDRLLRGIEIQNSGWDVRIDVQLERGPEQLQEPSSKQFERAFRASLIITYLPEGLSTILHVAVASSVADAIIDLASTYLHRN